MTNELGPRPGNPCAAYTTTPRQYGLPRLDRDKIHRAQVARVRQRYGWMYPEKKFGVCVEAMRRIDKRLAVLRPERDACALSLSIHEQVRAMSTVIGISPAVYRTWLAAKPANEIRRIPDAAVRIAELSRKVAVLEERRAILLACRDEILVTLLDEFNPAQLGRMIDRDRKRVVQIREKLSQAA